MTVTDGYSCKPFFPFSNAYLGISACTCSDRYVLAVLIHHYGIYGLNRMHCIQCFDNGRPLLTPFFCFYQEKFPLRMPSCHRHSFLPTRAPVEGHAFKSQLLCSIRGRPFQPVSFHPWACHLSAEQATRRHLPLRGSTPASCPVCGICSLRA